MLEHCENTDGLGAIFPPMVYSIIALRCLDYDLDSPTVQWALNQLDDLHIAEDDRVRVQPCLSPVWDTAIATIALADAQVPADHPAWARAIEWLLAKEVRNPGDWQIRRAGRRADRLALPVPQRVLSRSRRQRDGGARPQPVAAGQRPGRRRRRPAAASTGCSRCRIATAAGPPTTSTSTTRS